MTVNVAISVADFTSGKPAVGVTVKVARAIVDATGTVIVSTEAKTIRLTAGTATITLETGVVYRWAFTGLRGVEKAWYAAATTDTTAADLYRNHQVDPSTLQPFTPPPSVQDLVTQATGILQQVQATVGNIAFDGGSATSTYIGTIDIDGGTAS